MDWENSDSDDMTYFMVNSPLSMCEIILEQDEEKICIIKDAYTVVAEETVTAMEEEKICIAEDAFTVAAEETVTAMEEEKTYMAEDAFTVVAEETVTAMEEEAATVTAKVDAAALITAEEEVATVIAEMGATLLAEEAATAIFEETARLISKGAAKVIAEVAAKLGPKNDEPVPGPSTLVPRPHAKIRIGPWRPAPATTEDPVPGPSSLVPPPHAKIRIGPWRPAPATTEDAVQGPSSLVPRRHAKIRIGRPAPTTTKNPVPGPSSLVPRRRANIRIGRPAPTTTKDPVPGPSSLVPRRRANIRIGRPAPTTTKDPVPGPSSLVPRRRAKIRIGRPAPATTEDPVPGPSSLVPRRHAKIRIGPWRPAPATAEDTSDDHDRPSVISNMLQHRVECSNVWKDPRHQPYLRKLRDALQCLTDITTFQVIAARKQANRIVQEIRQQCDYSKIYAFFRFDDFMCQVEQRDKFYLGKSPIGVVSSSVILCTNKLARVAGVRTNMTVSKALGMCPSILLFHYKYAKYDYEMNRIKTILKEYDPWVTTTMDCAEICLIPNLEVSKEDAMDVVRQIKNRIYDTTEIQCTIGIGPTTVIASLAAELCSTYGTNQVRADKTAVNSFMKSLDLTKHGRLSTRFKVFLRVLDICTAGEILNNRIFLAFLCKKRNYYEIIGSALGIPTDSMRLQFLRTTNIPSIVSKSLRFFPVNDKTLISQHCRSICEMLEKELREMHVGGRIIMGFILTSGLTRKKKAHRMINHTNKSELLFVAAMKVINAFYADDPKIIFTEIEFQVRELARGFDDDDLDELDGFLMPPPPLTTRETRTHFINRRNLMSIFDLYHPRVPLRRQKNSKERVLALVGGTKKPSMTCSVCGWKIECSISENCDIWMKFHTNECVRDFPQQKVNVSKNAK